MSWSARPEAEAAVIPAVEAVPAGAIEVFGEQVRLAERYATLLVDPGITHGVIGPREAARIWTRHVLHCGVVAELVPPRAKVADLGSGAGLPGVPLALARPDVQVDLIEPMLRRTRFLDLVLADLGLDNASVVPARAEVHARTPARYDVVVARAVADLRTLAGWAVPLLTRGGSLLALKGERAAAEAADATAGLTAIGLVATVLSVGSPAINPPLTVVRVARAAT